MNYYELTLQRKLEIENGLLELMKHVPYSQITVTDIARHLGMSRKCFYHYFSGKEACLESLMDRMIRDAALYVATEPPCPDHALSQYIRNLVFWKGQHAFLEAILQNDLSAVFLQRCITHILEEERGTLELMGTAEMECDEDILLFFISGQISLLMRWCQRGYEPSVEEMARKFRRLFRMPLILPDKNEVW